MRLMISIMPKDEDREEAVICVASACINIPPVLNLAASFCISKPRIAFSYERCTHITKLIAFDDDILTTLYKACSRQTLSHAGTVHPGPYELTRYTNSYKIITGLITCLSPATPLGIRLPTVFPGGLLVAVLAALTETPSFAIPQARGSEQLPPLFSAIQTRVHPHLLSTLSHFPAPQQKHSGPVPSTSRQLHARNLPINLIHSPSPLLHPHNSRAHLTNRHLLDPDIPCPLHILIPLDQARRVEPATALGPSILPTLSAARVDCIHERGVQGQGSGVRD